MRSQRFQNVLVFLVRINIKMEKDPFKKMSRFFHFVAQQPKKLQELFQYASAQYAIISNMLKDSGE